MVNTTAYPSLSDPIPIQTKPFTKKHVSTIFTLQSVCLSAIGLRIHFLHQCIKNSSEMHPTYSLGTENVYGRSAKLIFQHHTLYANNPVHLICIALTRQPLPLHWLCNIYVMLHFTLPVDGAFYTDLWGGGEHRYAGGLNTLSDQGAHHASLIGAPFN
jgi:hypothetical protein